MSIFISLLKTVIAAAIAVAINFGLYTYTVTERDYTIRKDLAESGIVIEGYESRQGLLILELPTENSAVEKSDIMLIRKTLDALRASDLKYSQYYIKLKDPNGATIYSDMYTNITKINDKYAVTIPEKEVDGHDLA